VRRHEAKIRVENFSVLTKRLLSVPKAEIDKRHKEWEQERTENISLRKPADAAFPAIRRRYLVDLRVIRKLYPITREHPITGSLPFLPIIKVRPHLLAHPSNRILQLLVIAAMMGREEHHYHAC
jgi:hypothetical protein